MEKYLIFKESSQKLIVYSIPKNGKKFIWYKGKSLRACFTLE